jgi:hypothetical protein
MHQRVLLGLLACISMVLLSACRRDTPDQKEPVLKTHSSPNAVFDAYRQAARSGDWRAFYFLFTPEAQRDMVFEAEFVCGVRNDPALKVIQKRFGPAEAAVGQRYWKEYKRKHGHAEVIDTFLLKAIPYWERKEQLGGGKETAQAGTVPRPPESAVMDDLPDDEELLRQAVYDATKNKVAYFAEVQKLVGKGRKPNIVGDLEQVAIKGDTATGRVTITVVPQPPDSPQKIDKFDKTFKLRRINGGWLLDSL